MLVDADSDTFNDGDLNQDGQLSVGETWQYTASHTVTQAEIDAGAALNNTASASTAQGATDSDSASVTVVQPPHADMTLDKSDAVGTIFVDANENGVGDTGDGTTSGDLIEFVIQLKNVGNVPLSSVVVNDPLFGGVLGGPDGGDANNILDVGETWTWVRNHPLTTADVAAGHVLNSATATAHDPANNTVTATAFWDQVFPV